MSVRANKLQQPKCGTKIVCFGNVTNSLRHLACRSTVLNTSLNKYCEHKSSFFPCRDSLLSCILFFIPITFKKFVISTTLYLYFVWLSVWGMHHFATGLWGSHCSCDNHPQKSNLWLCGDSQCSTLSI